MHPSHSKPTIIHSFFSLRQHDLESYGLFLQAARQQSQARISSLSRSSRFQSFLLSALMQVFKKAMNNSQMSAQFLSQCAAVWGRQFLFINFSPSTTLKIGTMVLFFCLPIKLYTFHSTAYKLTPIVLKKIWKFHFLLLTWLYPHHSPNPAIFSLRV